MYHNIDAAAGLLNHRFEGTGALRGHSVRNLLVLAYFEQFGQNQEAIDRLAKDLGLVGRITPITFTNSHLAARLKDGSLLETQDDINRTDMEAHGGLEKMWLDPAGVLNADAIAAIKVADVVVVCPGSPGSIEPHFLVEGVVDTLKTSTAKKVFIVNSMNRHGFLADDASVVDHVNYFESKYLGKGFFDHVVYNTQVLKAEQRFKPSGERVLVPLLPPEFQNDPRYIGREILIDQVPVFKKTDAIAHLRSFVLHDPVKLGKVFEELFDGARTSYQTSALLQGLSAPRPTE